MHEDVMVVDTPLLQPFLTAPLIRDHAGDVLRLIETKHRFIPRPTAEVSPQYRQIIPYVVIRHDDDLFVLQRTARQTEARLHHKVSIGVGGHINPGHTLLEGLQKELNEEVEIGAVYDLQFAGILNDDTTDVGRVHLGAVYLLDAAEKRVTVRETEKMFGEWMRRSTLARVRDRMESWSQIVYDALLA